VSFGEDGVRIGAGMATLMPQQLVGATAMCEWERLEGVAEWHLAANDGISGSRHDGETVYRTRGLSSVAWRRNEASMLRAAWPGRDGRRPTKAAKNTFEAQMNRKIGGQVASNRSQPAVQSKAEVVA
jgi:hypothetical protein